ncbi:MULTISPECIES: MFS transporter [Rhodomicrobium]|uniref:MFS transporter n=1 Tax=Rhodomicrobium TaxID=1068 RepID=UPI000B4ABAD6|nr:MULTISPECIES: MFS transporter [Rhodomicrobium]
MSVAAEASVRPFKSHEGRRDQVDEEDDIPGFFRRSASVRLPEPDTPSRKTAANLVLLAFAGGYCLAYLFRSLPALMSEPLTRELKLTPADLGILSAAFFLATAALQLPIGVWFDRYGPRRVQGLLMFSAAIGAALFASTDNIVLLTIARMLIGIGAAGGFMAGLKAIALWYPPDRIALANGWLVMLGSFGACLATWPAAMMMAEIGWRGLFLVLAGLTAASALAILMLVPERRRQRNAIKSASSISILSIYRDAGFWRLAPLSALSVGSAWAFQGLWAAPWLRAVEGFGQDVIVTYLLAMAVVLAPSALLLGMGVQQLRRRGISLACLFAFVTALGMGAELALILRMPLPPLLPWLIIAGIGTVTVLSFTILGDMYPASGRANAALNLLHMSATFLIQSGIGFFIEQWDAENGQFPPIAYQSALAVVLATQLAAWGAFVWPRRIRRAGHLRAHRVHALARQLGLTAATAMPYLKARQVWRVRLLDARRQRRSWRQAGLVSLTVSSSLALWMIWVSMQATVIPHVIKVRDLRQPGEIWRIPPSALHTAPSPQAASASAP